MNEHLRNLASGTLGVRRDLTRPSLPWPDTTQAAEGMPRRPWTRAEIEAMVRAGIIDEDERFELIGGEVVPMSPKGASHEWVKHELNQHLQRTVSGHLAVMQETTLWLDEISFVEPDFIVVPRGVLGRSAQAADVLLAIEVADTSLHYDRGRKIGIYAAHGIPEVWVVNAWTLETEVFRGLGSQPYAERSTVGPDAELACPRAGVTVSLGTLGVPPAKDGDDGA